MSPRPPRTALLEDGSISRNGAVAPAPTPAPATPAPMVTGDALLVTALLEQLQREENPWELLAQVQKALDERKIGVADRHEFYKLFTVLVAMQPKAEEDALLQAGKAVFGYQLPTARKDIAALRSQIAPHPVTFFVNDELLADVIRRGAGPVEFLLFTSATGASDIADELKTGTDILYPPRSGFIDATKGTSTVLLADGIDEYGDDGALFEALGDYVTSVVHHTHPSFRAVVSSYVLMSWVFDKFDSVPYLRALGDWGGGKSRLLEALGAVVYRGIAAGSSSPAAIFRVLDATRGSLVIDESDFTDRGERGDLLKIFLSGYAVGHPVLRCEKNGADGFDVKAFDTFGPKVLATRTTFPDPALESRCLTFLFTQGRLPSHIPFNFDEACRARAARLRRQLLLWRLRHWRTVGVESRHRIGGLPPRLNQLVLPLLAVAPPPAHVAILHYVRELAGASREDRHGSVEGRVLAALQVLTLKSPGEARWPVGQIAERVNYADLPDREKVSHDRIGSTMVALGFRKATGTAVRAYRVDRMKLGDLLAAYDLPSIRQAESV